MKAYVYTKYGPPDVLELKEIEKPTLKEDQVLVKVHATSLNAYDWHLLKADPFLVRLMGGGLLKPKTPASPGQTWPGGWRRLASAVTQFKPGEEVYGEVTGGGCGGLCRVCGCVRAARWRPSPRT